MHSVHYKAFNFEEFARFARASAATSAALGPDLLRKTVGCVRLSVHTLTYARAWKCGRYKERSSIWLCQQLKQAAPIMTQF